LIPLTKPVMAATPIDSCVNDSNISFSSLFSYIGNIIVSGGSLFLVNFVTSGAAQIPVVGGLFEPFDEVSDFLFNKWMWAVLLGIAGTFGAMIAGSLVDSALILNMSITDPSAPNPVIAAGYGTILSLVNLGFVIAIIIIAFATMFRRSGWNAQSALVKLIIAALLINFSLFIGGTVLDLGTGLTKAFLSGGNCLGSNIAARFNVVNVHNNVKTFLNKASTAENIYIPENKNNLSNEKDSFLKSTFMKFLTAILSIFLSSAIAVIGALTLFAIFLFLIARYVAVTLLLIFMPLAWLGLVFPNIPVIGNLWSKWWGAYLKWVFFGPILAFLLYLTVSLMNYVFDPATASQIQGIGLFGGVTQMILLVIFSLSGLYAANKLGVVGANAVYGLASKWGKAGLANIKSGALGVATSPLRTKLGQEALGKLARRPTLFGVKVSTGMQEIGRAGLAASVAGMGSGKDFAKKFGALPKERQEDILLGIRPDSAEFAAGAEQLLKDGKMSEKTADRLLTDRVKRGLRYTMKESVYGDIEKSAWKTKESQKAVAEGRIDDASKIIFERFKNEKIDKEFGKNVANVYKRGDAVQMKIVTEMLLKMSPEAIKAPLGQMETRNQRDNFERSINGTWESSGVGKEMKATEEIESLIKNQVGKIKRETEIEMEKFKDDGNKKANIMRESDAEIERIRESGKTNLENTRKEIKKTFTEFDKAVSDRVKEYWPSVRKLIHSGEYKEEDVVEREELKSYAKKED